MEEEKKTEEKDNIVPDNANEHCPGVKSEKAGKSESCKDCPNVSNCLSGESKKEDPSIDEIKIAMKYIKHKILILSGNYINEL
jgi:hypothetical protein